MQDPAEVAAGLDEIAALSGFAGAPKFKVRAYERAARIVAAAGDRLGALIERDAVRELAGIGAALSRQIHELWNTGTSDFLERLRQECPRGAAALVHVEGMTPRRIRALDAALGVHSVEALRAACLAGQVRAVPGFGPKTEARLLDAAERRLGQGSAPPRPLIRPQALELAAELVRHVSSVLPGAEIAGAVRRGDDTIDALDLVVRGEPSVALRELSRWRQVVRVDAAERSAQLAAGVPLRLHPSEPGLGNALFFATGSAEHVTAVRARARSRGFELAGAPDPVPGLTPMSFTTEAELYAAAGLAPIPPELRQGQGEVELASEDDFSDLVRVEDIRGMVHCHTAYSDGKHSIAEMAEAAQALGMQYITITDHSPSAHYASGVDLDRLKQQWDEIAAVQERLEIRILRGTESDILADGSLDYPAAVLEQFEVVIASIHARHRLDAKQMTERLVRALSLPVFKIWGHGLGRILNHRPPIDCDVPRVLDALASSRGAVELNADPHRLDLPAAWIPAARARGIPFVISVDAHSARGFGALAHGVTLARRGGVRRAEVLNARPPAEFAALVRP